MFQRRDPAPSLEQLLSEEGLSPAIGELLREHGIVSARDLLRADWGRLQLLLGPGRAKDALHLDALKRRTAASRAS